ncbi:MAG: hypothetical protein IJ566_05485 [Cardiobacteriaceae bacterium]|nr:hypothetical protein [Cardiobacteriaceae bacterium]
MKQIIFTAIFFTFFSTLLTACSTKKASQNNSIAPPPTFTETNSEKSETVLYGSIAYDASISR